jgi:hypothetical protein
MERFWRINMQNLSKKEIEQLFEEGVSMGLRKTQADLVAQMVADLLHTVSEKELSIKFIIEFLTHQIAQLLIELLSLKSDYLEFSRKYHGAKELEVIRHNVLEYAKRLGSNEKQLAQDERAFERWFGFDAISERYFQKVSLLEKKLNFCLQKLGTLSAFLLKTVTEETECCALWRVLNLENVIQPVLAYERDHRICTTAFRAMVVALKALPASIQQTCLEANTLHYIYKAALSDKPPLWIQCEALSLLSSLSSKDFYTVLCKRLENPLGGDDFFLRSRAVMLLGANTEWQPNFEALLEIVSKDPSPYVRQRLAEALKKAPDSVVMFWMKHLIIHDSVKEVKAQALLEIPFHLKNEALLEHWKLLLSEVLLKERDVFVVRVALEVIVMGLSYFVDNIDPKNAQAWWAFFIPNVQTIHLNAPALSLRRFAAAICERLWCIYAEEPRALKAQLEKILAGDVFEKKMKISGEQFQGCSENIVARVLSVMAQDGYGYEIEYRDRWQWIRRGYQMGFRFWRFLFEMRNPYPEKRQAFSHTMGRIFSGNIHIPSMILSEVSETTVPGEPYLIATEFGWRPYLPLVDELYSCLRFFDSTPFSIYTSEGITFIEPPTSPMGRFYAKCVLIWRFQDFAMLRNWHEKSQINPNCYVQAIKKLGIMITFEPHCYAEMKEQGVDSTIMRFFV